jgi:uncharacterized protein YciI
MLYAVICTDKPHAVDKRMEVRLNHLKFLDAIGTRLKAGGPFLADDGSPTGTMLLVEANNRDECLAVIEEDPYSQAGLFESAEIRPWLWLIGNPEG